MGTLVTAVAVLLLGTTHARAARTPQSALHEEADVANTASGKVRGTRLPNGGLGAFAVPYAESPTDARRFRPPQPVKPWKATLDATQGNPRQQKCPQVGIKSFFEPVAVDYTGNEDCLTLDFFVPSTAARVRAGGAKDASLPVMVFVHGGGFTVGDEEQFGFGKFDGSVFAENTGVILFSVNYRLGPFGFLAHPALAYDDDHSKAQAMGNLGLRDQRVAMAWAKATAPMLGGDGSRITIFGQSAGGMSICYHYTSPASAPLFTSAIIESGNCGIAPQVWTPATDALSLGIQYVKSIGCDEDDGKPTATRDANEIRSCLQRASTNDIMKHSLDPSKAVRTGFIPPLAPVMSWTPTVDGTRGGVLASPLALVRNGQVSPKPLIAGHTKDEMKLFVYLAPFVAKVVIPLTEKAAEDVMRKMLMDSDGNLTRHILDEYPASDYADPGDRMEAAMRDWFFACDMARFVHAAAQQGAPARLYRFSYPIRWFDSTELGMRDYHASELPFVFHMAYPPLHTFNADDDAMSAAFEWYWGAFAHGGNSSVAARGSAAARRPASWPTPWPAWPLAYGGDTADAWLELGLGRTVRPVHGLSASGHCSFWDRVASGGGVARASSL